ncbi:MAG: galactokinase [Mucilaginibacter sp.]
MKTQLQQQFNNIYHKPAEKFYFSPGRVNLIGEHIDFNGGLVMPCAINMGTYLLISFNNDNVLRLRSLNFDETLDTPLIDQYQKTGNKWFNYPLGVVNLFLKDGHQIGGIDFLYYGDIPIGSGLSSSASIEIVTAFALNDIFNAGYSKLDLVKMCKRVENEFIGLNSGIMDQFAVAFGQKGKAVLIDCNKLTYEAVNCDLKEYELVIINTNKPRKLAESSYNDRAQDCQNALTMLKKELDINYLCDIDTNKFNAYKHLITDENAAKRAQHVIEENDRVKIATIALNSGDISRFGELMYASHYSLKDKYEVSGKELDSIVEYCESDKNVAGARMTGAGFGGCAIALVKKGKFEAFSTGVIEYYTNHIGYAPSVYNAVISNGVGII